MLGAALLTLHAAAALGGLVLFLAAWTGALVLVADHTKGPR